MTNLEINQAKTRLEKRVQKIINAHAADYDNGAFGYIKDVLYGGCVSGIVGELIYYTDTVKFYRLYQKEIDALLTETLSDTGDTPSQLFSRAGWDDDDPLAREQVNQNILAWFGFEETTRILADRAGLGY